MAHFKLGGSPSYGLLNTVTSGGILTLTSNSKEYLLFTGTEDHTVKLPDPSVCIGKSFTIINHSTGIVTVQSSKGTVLSPVAPGTLSMFNIMDLDNIEINGAVTRQYGETDDQLRERLNPIKCECGKEKHGFASHSTWCKKWKTT